MIRLTLLLSLTGASLVLADTCPTPPSDTKCVQVRNYDDVKKMMEGVKSGGSLCLQGFNIDKSEDDGAIRLSDTDVHIWCKAGQTCRLKGEGSTLFIRGDSAKITLTGLTFAGATRRAVTIYRRAGSAKKYQQKICGVKFEDCVGKSRGSALKIEDGTNVLVEGSTFSDNSSGQQGAGIYIEEAELRVIDSKFENNIAHLGGGVHAEEAQVYMKDCTFLGNQAKGRGPAVLLRGDDSDFVDGGGNTGSNNRNVKSNTVGDCNGVFDDDKKCHEFDPADQSAVGGDDFDDEDPELTPVPTEKPSPLPTPRPTLRPNSSGVGSDSVFISTPGPTPNPTPKPTSKPTNKPVPSASAQVLYPAHPKRSNPPSSYYNYDKADKQNGPDNWKDVSYKTSEYYYWSKFDDVLKPSLKKNYCGTKDRQSPIMLGPKTATGDCEEYHEIRDMPGELPLNHDDVTMKIEKDHLRIEYKWDEDQTEHDTSRQFSVPHLDMPKAWGHFYPVVHCELNMPALHVFEGHPRAPAEWTCFIMSDRGRGGASVSTLILPDPWDQDNLEFQKAIDAWEQVYVSPNTCKRRRDLRDEAKTDVMHTDNGTVESMNNATTVQDRVLSHTRPNLVSDVFNVFHPTLMPSIHFFGYEGSTPRPPCYPIVEWRVMDTYAYMSTAQLNRLRYLLYTNADEKDDCKPKSVHAVENGFPVSSRETQSYIVKEHDLHQCTCEDFYSDQFRKMTGLRDCR